MVTGASKAVSDPLTVPSTVAEPWKTTRSPTVWPLGTSARPERTTNASVVWASCAHAGAAKPSMRRNKSPITIDRRMPITSHSSSPVLGQCSQLNTNRHDKPYGVSAHFVVQAGSTPAAMPAEVIYHPPPLANCGRSSMGSKEGDSGGRLALPKAPGSKWSVGPFSQPMTLG